MQANEIRSMLDCAETLYPQVPVVGYSPTPKREVYTDTGFVAIAPHVVWARGK